MEEQNQTNEQNQATLASSGGRSKNIGMAVVAYILFFIPLLTDAKNDPFVKYHVRQGFVLFLSWMVVAVLSWMPVINFFAWVLNVGLIVLFIIGIMNAVGGRQNPLPIIGGWAKNFNL